MYFTLNYFIVYYLKGFVMKDALISSSLRFILFAFIIISSQTLAENKNPSALTLGGAIFNNDSKGPSKKAKAAIKKLKKAFDLSKVSTAALQRKLGRKPKKIFQYIQNNIALHPYAGILRGSKGALISQSANSIDRSLLLAQLFKQAGFKTRLVSAKLVPDLADTLLFHIINQHKSIQITGNKMNDLIGVMGRELMYIGDAMSQIKLKYPSDFSFAWKQAVKNVQQHYWVQYQAKKSSSKTKAEWIDLDPSMGSSFGSALIPAEKFYQSIADLPSTLHRNIKIEFEVTQNTKDAKAEIKLSYSSQIKTFGYKAIGYYFNASGSNAKPVLLIGNKKIKGKTIKVGFELTKKGLGFAPSSKILDLFSKLPSGANKKSKSDKNSKKKSNFVAKIKSINLIITESFNGQSNTSSHKVYSLQQASASDIAANVKTNQQALKKALTQVGAIAIQVGNNNLHHAIQLMSMKKAITNAKNVIRGLTLLNYSYLSIRQRFPASIANKAIRFHSGANIIISKIISDHKLKQTTLSMDLTKKNFQMLWLPDLQKTKLHPFVDSIANGVLDHVIERTILRKNISDYTVGGLTDYAIQKKLPLLAINLKSHASFQEAHLLAIPTSKLKENLFVSLKEKPQNWPAEKADKMGWWIVNLKTGKTKDENLSGYHSVSADHAQGVAQRASWAKRYRNLGCTIMVVVGSTTVQVGETMTTFDPVEGAGLTVIGGGLEALGELACKKTPSIRAPSVSPARFTPGTGFRPRPNAIINHFTNMGGTIRRFR